MMASPAGHCRSCGGTLYTDCHGQPTTHLCPPDPAIARLVEKHVAAAKKPAARATRRACPHRVLFHVGRNAGVACARCKKVWTRRVHYVGTIRISRLVSR